MRRYLDQIVSVMRTNKHLRNFAYSSRRYIITKSEKALSQYLVSDANTPSILLSGFQKSGNTWTRFIFFNYLNLLNGAEPVTLDFKALNTIQSHDLDDPSTYGFPGQKGYPVFYRTHVPYSKVYGKFDKIIYIYRNPLDTLISLYHYVRNRSEPFSRFMLPLKTTEKLYDLDYFILYQIHRWLYHYTRTLPKSDLVLNYEDLREAPYDIFQNMFKQLKWEIVPDLLQKSIELSSFDNIKKMSEEKAQHQGMGDDSFHGKFTRSGKSGQYNEVLKLETIEKVQYYLNKNHILLKL